MKFDEMKVIVHFLDQDMRLAEWFTFSTSFHMLVLKMESHIGSNTLFPLDGNAWVNTQCIDYVTVISKNNIKKILFK